MALKKALKKAPIAKPENTELPPTPILDRTRGILRLPRVKVPDRVKKVFRTIYHIVSSHLGLLFILFTYSFIGAAIFSAIEKPREDAEWQQMLQSHNASIQQILNVTFNAFNNNVTMQDENLTKIVEDIMIQHAASYGAGKSEYAWDFWNSMLFCATVYTTIVASQIKMRAESRNIFESELKSQGFLGDGFGCR
ncbi:hypothetical protein CAPTEDRAFT_211279 [Capitella teleta]|uniref:Potassium channel domain-containing protein n=1 Tax=Capitella teleta TaxID=283909 RepID=R7TIM4_CAPTE|nr:hypothetical protein CAPTEDRAFT_211279 [Capitella teleta]|eukprot:ELT93589.1 hypothetical protein CAPTEDRAFT_211279 [Capitella teleta]